MDTVFEAVADDERPIVYIRPVPVANLPEDIRARIGGREIVYSVNRDDGERLALVADRRLAFLLARSHDMAPVSVH